jgi:predicted Ser/Thr protein kinase
VPAVIAVGQVLSGKYRLARLLGDGGMGSVYEASHEGLGTRVAIKVLHTDLARRQGLVERFLREARVSAQIRSPNVVQVVDVDRTQDGDAYIVMELLEGEPLSSVLERERRLSIPVACDYTMQVLQALEAAHALGVVHRDLKPENVFVTSVAGKPLLKLIDFGIAKARLSDPGTKNLTVAGVIMGTAEYMAPEQAHSADKVDARSDLYAVGVMLYEMIAGSRPVSGDDARIIALKVERGEATPLVHAVPDVPRELAGLVHRAMAARPELRFASATEMRLALEKAMVGRPRSPTARLPEMGTGTVMGPPTGEAMAVAMQPPRYAQQSPAVRTSPGGGGPPMGPAMGVTPVLPAQLTPSPTRYRRRRGGGAWLLLFVPILVGGGVAIFFAVNGSTDPTPPPPQPTATVTATATATATAAVTTAPAVTETVPPLIPSPTTHPAVVHPHPSASGSAPAPSATQNVPGLPFPPGFPSNIPLPFPTTSGSGVGPVITIPTTLPFPLPQLGQPPPPAATSPSPPASS